jgi:hypothetical protein
MIPLDFLMQIGNSEYGKNRQSQNFLNDFELSDRKGTAPKPVGRHSQAILEKCDSQLIAMTAQRGAVLNFK